MPLPRKDTNQWWDQCLSPESVTQVDKTYVIIFEWSFSTCEERLINIVPIVVSRRSSRYIVGQEVFQELRNMLSKMTQYWNLRFVERNAVANHLHVFSLLNTSNDFLYALAPSLSGWNRRHALLKCCLATASRNNANSSRSRQNVIIIWIKGTF